MTLMGNPQIQLVYRHQTEEGIFTADSEELKEVPDGFSLQGKATKNAVIAWIKNNLEDIKASK